MESLNKFPYTSGKPNFDQDQLARERRDARIRTLHRELYYLWDYVGTEGLWLDAKDYVEDHCLDPIPYEW